LRQHYPYSNLKYLIEYVAHCRSAIEDVLMDSNQQQQYLEELRGVHERRLHELELQAARMGQDTPAHIRTEIEDIEKTIADINERGRSPTYNMPWLTPFSKIIRRFFWLLFGMFGLLIGINMPAISGRFYALISPAPPQQQITTPDPAVLLYRVVRKTSEIAIDGSIDEDAWSKAGELRYASHPKQNDSTIAIVRFLWDDDYLYVSFDVNDTQVEMADPSTLWDGDSVSLLLHERGIAEYRQSLGESPIGDIAMQLKPKTTLSDPADTDVGYRVEMRVKWKDPPSPGKRISADLLSVDHDANPGAKSDVPGTIFSKLTWDGDGNISTAGAILLLVSGK
jgi:hypothetical protein